MWNGPQVSGEEVFKIWNNNGTHELYMRGNGEFTGKITANEGVVAGWGITSSNNGGQLLSCRDGSGVLLEPTWDNFVSY
jgi:hypothetical protein